MDFFRKKKTKKGRTGWIIWMLVLTLVFAGVGWGIHSQAADKIWLECGGVKLGTEYTMDTSAINLHLGSSGTQYASDKYKIHWKIPIKEHQDIIGFQDTTNKGEYEGGFSCVVTAKKPGKAELIVDVYDSTGNTPGTTVTGSSMTIAQHVTLTINVVFAIDTLGADYNKVHDTDTEPSLIMYTKDEKRMKLNIGEAGNHILWRSADEDVVKMKTTSEGAIVAEAVGCGKTSISATDSSGNTDSISVYVTPKIANAKGGEFSKAATYNISSGDYLYTDAAFMENRTLTIKDKMVWVISKYDSKNNQVVIEDSLGHTESNLIELTTASVDDPQNLKVTAKAGQYIIAFYPIGSYNSEADKSTIVPTTVVINVCANMQPRDVNLTVGDQFSIPDAINITKEEFNEWFDIIFDNEQFDTYFNCEKSSGLITAKKATGQDSFGVTIVAKRDYKDKVNALLQSKMDNPQVKFTFRVVDELTLNMRNVSIVVGEEMQLIATTATYEGELTWESSDTKYVTVSDSGVIKGISKTTDDITITVSQKMNDGSIKKATCKVKVEETVKNISLSDTDIELLEGSVKTVTAFFKPDRNQAPIQWMSSDPNVFTINISSDKKSVVVTGKKAGTAVLTALNEENYVTAVCKVTILSQITKISLPATQMTVKLNREVVRMVASYAPATATNNRLEWDSSDPSVATVNESGLVTLLKAGTTIITVKPQYNTSPPIMAQCILTVLQSSVGIKMDKSSITLGAGETYGLNYMLTPANATANVTWKSMDSSIATVNAKGLVVAKKAGTTYIVVTSADGYSSECKVVVTQDAMGIKLSATNLTLGVGDSYAVGVTITPQNATDKTITWTSQDPGVARVTNDGKITGVAVGTAIIAAKIKTGEVAYLTVTVKDVVKSLALDQSNKTIGVGKSFILKPIFTPENATNTKVTWKSSDSKIATVSSTGKVTGVKGGTAMIICAAEDGGYTANCIVTVQELVTDVKLNHTSYKLTVNKSVTLKATVKSNNASNKKVKWTTSNKKIATVNQKGKVTAKKLGTCTIRATATDGSGETATCTIRVIRRVSKLKISNSYIKLLEGKSKQLKSKVSPSSATIKGVKWKSSDTSVAIVSSSGKVHALTEGTAKIYVTTTDGSNIKATCTVQVIKAVPVTSLTVTAQDITYGTGNFTKCFCCNFSCKYNRQDYLYQ